MENDYPEELESQLNENKEAKKENTEEFVLKKQSKSNRASKRPVQRAKEPLDIEPLDDKKLVIDNKQSESVEIDDPW